METVVETYESLYQAIENIDGISEESRRDKLSRLSEIVVELNKETKHDLVDGI